jgi:hypothetical protein
MFLRNIFLMGVFLLFSSTYVLASMVNLPTALLQTNSDEDTNHMNQNMTSRDYYDQSYKDRVWYQRISLSAKGDWLRERQLDRNDAEIKGKFYTAELSLPAYVFGPWDFYGSVGMTDDLRVNSSFGTTDVDYHLDDAFVWDAGANWVPFQIPMGVETMGAALFVDAKYRSINDTDYNAVSVNGTSRTFTNNDDAQFKEWQGAVGLAIKTKYVVPYIGGKYSDVRQDADVSVAGTRYNLNNAESDKKWGPFAGIALAANNYLSANVQGRFVDEKAISGEVTLRF